MSRTAAAELKMRNRLDYVSSRTRSCIDGEWSTVLTIHSQVPTHCNVKRKSLNGNERIGNFHSLSNYIFPREIELKFVNEIGFET